MYCHSRILKVSIVEGVMSQIVSSDNKRIAKNTIYLYIRMFFALIINLYTSRIVLRTLGVEDYGVYNVVAGFVSLFGFLNATLSSSVQRFYNYEETHRGKDGFVNVYVTSLIIHAVIAFLLLVLLETVGLWYVNNIMIVPDSRLFAANILFQATSISMILMIIQISYLGAVMAKEHMDVYAIVSIVDIVLKLIIAVAISLAECDKLILYGILLSAVSVVDLSIYIIYCTKHFPEMKFYLNFDKRLFKSMLSFSGWNLIGTFAFMLKGQGVNMLLNYFFGPIVNAARGVSYQVNSAVSSFTSAITTAFSPQVVTSYAQGNNTRTINIMFAESKICFSLMSIIIVPVVLEIDYLLHLWLGDVVPDHTGVFSILVLIDTLICTLNTPCTQLVFATGRIKYYQICSTLVNISLLPLAWFLLYLGYSANSAFITTIIISCLNQSVCLFLTNREYSFGIGVYIKKIVLRCVALIVLLPIIPGLIRYLMPESLGRVFAVSAFSLLIGALLVYCIVFEGSEKSIVKQFVRSRINNKKYAES